MVLFLKERNIFDLQGTRRHSRSYRLLFSAWLSQGTLYLIARPRRRAAIRGQLCDVRLSCAERWANKGALSDGFYRPVIISSCEPHHFIKTFVLKALHRLARCTGHWSKTEWHREASAGIPSCWHSKSLSVPPLPRLLLFLYLTNSNYLKFYKSTAEWKNHVNLWSLVCCSNQWWTVSGKVSQKWCPYYFWFLLVSVMYIIGMGSTTTFGFRSGIK